MKYMLLLFFFCFPYFYSIFSFRSFVRSGQSKKHSATKRAPHSIRFGCVFLVRVFILAIALDNVVLPGCSISSFIFYAPSSSYFCVLLSAERLSEPMGQEFTIGSQKQTLCVCELGKLCALAAQHPPPTLFRHCPTSFYTYSWQVNAGIHARYIGLCV